MSALGLSTNLRDTQSCLTVTSRHSFHLCNSCWLQHYTHCILWAFIISGRIDYLGKGSMSTERGDDISGHMGNSSAFWFYRHSLVGGGYLRPQKLAQAPATSESALAFNLGKSSELVPFRAVREIHLKM